MKKKPAAKTAKRPGGTAGASTRPKATAGRKTAPAKSGAAPSSSRASQPAQASPKAETQASPKAGKRTRLAAAPDAAPDAGQDAGQDKARVLSSEVVFQGPLFRVQRDRIVEPTGLKSVRDVVRHNGSVVILAVDRSASKKNPWVVMERQYRHAANRFLWELPAGKLEAGEEPMAGAQRELAEETGYRARKWRPLAEYYASPGFLGESMKLFLADGLYAGDATPEDDERIDFRLVRLADILKMIDKGEIHDGKTLNAILLYARMRERKRKK